MADDWRERLASLEQSAPEPHDVPDPLPMFRRRRVCVPTLEHPDDPIEAAAYKAAERDPHVLREIIDVSLEMLDHGWRHWSIKAAFEVIRYNAAIRTSGRTYKLNNNHAAWFSRWIMRDVPELDGFFDTREGGRVHQEYDE